MPKVIVIGSGFSGISAAAYLADAGHKVHVYEKNSTAGGRARQFKTQEGYIFDMGPSWYWMPDIFEQFFQDFGAKVSDYYHLSLLSPSFEVVFRNRENLTVPADYSKLREVFETIEKGSAVRLEKFMQDAEYKYRVGTEAMGNMPGISCREFLHPDLMKGAIRLQLFSSFSKHVRKYFSHPKLIVLMEFPVLFLGAMPEKIPAMYSLMNYAGFKLGTWYPQGGFGRVVESMMELAISKGAKFHFNSAVEKINLEKGMAKSVQVNAEDIPCDAVIASADYQHVEEVLLPEQYKNYSNKYWQKKTFAPSSLIFYLGVNKKLDKLQHHTLFFEEDFSLHSKEIYQMPQWPSKPLFYVCCPSKTDNSVAPEGHENLFLLMPLAPGIEDNEEQREKYFQIMMKRLEKHVGTDISKSIDYKRSYCIKDFIQDYNSYKGNAYGLANTLAQTAMLKPSIKNKKISNLFYTGQLTVPGPGVPPALISGKIVAKQLLKQLKPIAHEAAL